MEQLPRGPSRLLFCACSIIVCVMCTEDNNCRDCWRLDVKCSCNWKFCWGFDQGSIIHRLDPELTRRLKFLIEFKMPDPTVRACMWRKMLPDKVFPIGCSFSITKDSHICWCCCVFHHFMSVFNPKIQCPLCNSSLIQQRTIWTCKT